MDYLESDYSDSFNADWDYFYNSDNIKDQSFIFEIVEYFENGAGFLDFEPLEFLNLLYRQIHILEAHSNYPFKTFQCLKGLILNDIQRQTLYGFILKSFGGYPIVNERLDIYSTLKLIEKEFLCFEGDKPDKNYFKSEQVAGDGQRTAKSQTFESSFRLSSRRGMKTDLIRVLHALYELHFFEKPDGQIPTKEDFMIESGHFFGTDLSHYHSNLSQALKEQPLEVNLKIFDQMKSVTQKSHYES